MWIRVVSETDSINGSYLNQSIEVNVVVCGVEVEVNGHRTEELVTDNASISSHEVCRSLHMSTQSTARELHHIYGECGRLMGHTWS